MPTQVQNGKAFEYALMNEAEIILSRAVAVTVIKDASYASCLGCYHMLTPAQQARFSQAANSAINHILSLEPRLSHQANNNDVLELRLQPDAAGIAGDVRDLLFIRQVQNWEIGISAKNNHKALKHSRLSTVKDFGASWVNIPCSANYFNNITPIFTHLAALRGTGTLWRNVPNKHIEVYQPILSAFNNELAGINNGNPNIPQNLIQYLVGRNDFYKVIRRARVVEILAFNIHGALGRNAGRQRSAIPVPRLALPAQIVRSQILAGRAGVLEMIFDQGWQLSFRIHSAESLVAASLKFDVTLEGNPHTMYSHHVAY